ARRARVCSSSTLRSAGVSSTSRRSRPTRPTPSARRRAISRWPRARSRRPPPRSTARRSPPPRRRSSPPRAPARAGAAPAGASSAAWLLASTGTPAAFLHATEVSHGCVGQTRPGDVVIAISNRGSTDELLRAVDALREFGVRILAVTGRRDSPLARAADLVLEAAVEEEGDSLGLAPRASVLAGLLVLGALSVQLQEAKGFT